MSDEERMVEPTVGQLGLCGEDAGMMRIKPEWLDDTEPGTVGKILHYEGRSNLIGPLPGGVEADEDPPLVGLEGDLSWLTGKKP